MAVEPPPPTLLKAPRGPASVLAQATMLRRDEPRRAKLQVAVAPPAEIVASEASLGALRAPSPSPSSMWQRRIVVDAAQATISQAHPLLPFAVLGTSAGAVMCFGVHRRDTVLDATAAATTCAESDILTS